MSAVDIVRKLPQGCGNTLANRFFEDPWRGAVDDKKAFHAAVGDSALQYAEGYSSSALLEGMRWNGARVLPEVPVTRKARGRQGERSATGCDHHGPDSVPTSGPRRCGSPRPGGRAAYPRPS